MTQISQNGFERLDAVLSRAECEELATVLTQSGQRRSRAGMRHLMEIREVANLASDARLLQMARQALGGTAIPYRATLFEKSGHANWLVAWHQDTALPLESQIPGSEWGPWSTKAGLRYAIAPAWALERVIALRIHIDASTPENGPLRVIPGSHRHGVLTHERILEMARHSNSVEFPMPQGGVLAMRPLLIHASSKVRSDSPRRVLHIEYADSLTLAPGVRLAVA